MGIRSQKLALRRNRGAVGRHRDRARAQVQAGSSRTCISLECRRFCRRLFRPHVPHCPHFISAAKASLPEPIYTASDFRLRGLARASRGSYSRRHGVDQFCEFIRGSLPESCHGIYKHREHELCLSSITCPVPIFRCSQTIAQLTMGREGTRTAAEYMVLTWCWRETCSLRAHARVFIF